MAVVITGHCVFMINFKFVKMRLIERNMKRYKKCRNYVVIIVVIDRYADRDAFMKNWKT